MNKQQYDEMYKLLNNKKVDLHGLKTDLQGTWVDEKAYCSHNGIKSHWLRVTERAYRVFEAALSVSTSDPIREICDEIDEIPNLYQLRVRKLISIEAHNYINN